jgi:hypothetical protein
MSEYNTNLSKAQGIVPETLELLAIWEPGMKAAELKNHVHATGALSRETATRINDLVTRGFAQRYLLDGDKPAIWLKHLLASGINGSALRQILFIYTARHNPVFHDFVTSTYWRRVSTGASDISRSDARDFLEKAVIAGQIEPRWAESMMARVGRYLLGTLEDFQLIGKNRAGHRGINPPVISPETVRFLLHDLHFHGTEDPALPAHPDWGLFGLYPADVIKEIEKEASRGHIQAQNAGQFLRIEWHYPNMESAIDAIAH